MVVVVDSLVVDLALDIDLEMVVGVHQIDLVAVVVAVVLDYKMVDFVVDLVDNMDLFLDQSELDLSFVDLVENFGFVALVDSYLFLDQLLEGNSDFENYLDFVLVGNNWYPVQLEEAD
jgi:hypothetical protein